MTQALSKHMRVPQGIANDGETRVTAVVADFDRAKNARASRENLWEECYKLYRSTPPDPQKLADGRPLDKSNLFIPITFGVIESAVPKAVGALFAQSPIVGVLPREQKDEDAAEVMEALLQYQFERMHFQDLMEDYVKTCFLYGTAVFKVSWRKDVRTMRTREMHRLPGMMGVLMPWLRVPAEVDNDVTEYDDPWIELIDLWDFYVDPDATSVDDARYVIHRVWRTLAEIEELEKKGIYKNTAAIREGYADAEQKGRWIRAGAVKEDVPGGDAYSDENRPIELLEYWTDDWVTVVAARTVEIRDEPLPFYHGRKPFVEINDHSIAHEFYGVGEVEPIRFLQYEVNTLRNQTIDATSASINQMGWYTDAVDDPGELYNKAGHWIKGQYNRDFGHVPNPRVNMAGVQQEQIARNDIQWILQLFDSTRGELPSRRETATTTAITQQRADERFNSKIRRIEYQGIRRVARLLIALNQQFIDNEKVIRVVGEQGVSWRTVSPESIMGTFDLVPKGSAQDPLIGRGQQAQSMMQFAEFLAQIPPLAQATDWIALARKIGEKIGIQGLDEILRNNPAAMLGSAAPAMPGQAPMGTGGEVAPEEAIQRNAMAPMRGADGSL